MRNQTEILGDDVSFHTTSWTLVRSAGNLESLDALIRIYWKPLYFFVRQRGYDNETAKDIVQEFLAVLLERNAFAKADPGRGRFRTFLLAALSNFLKDYSKSASRHKRGGGQSILSLDFESGESEYRLEVAAGETPENVLNRAWARNLWRQALSDLKGDPAHLEAFRLYLQDVDYATISARTGLSKSAAKVAVHRLKGQLRDLVTRYIGATASNPEEMRAEITEFLELLGSSPPKAPA
ncbi:MAG TPA: sigma-70 family RNA polymerase sigma factor [Planctomycetota bacterium]|nr:sigma-70 family RNA polymerase sigma factor [Planctomycetota bacterium]